MDNRYLYKAKRTDNGEWVYGSLITGVFFRGGNDIPYILCPNKADYDCFEDFTEDNGIFEVDPSTICQCTGLKDKNGKLIYEGDIVKCTDEFNEIEFTACVKFGNPNHSYSWGYQLNHISGDTPNTDILLWVEMEETGAHIEVIGSEIDNPELQEMATVGKRGKQWVIHN